MTESEFYKRCIKYIILTCSNSFCNSNSNNGKGLRSIVGYDTNIELIGPPNTSVSELLKFQEFQIVGHMHRICSFFFIFVQFDGFPVLNLEYTHYLPIEFKAIKDQLLLLLLSSSPPSSSWSPQASVSSWPSTSAAPCALPSWARTRSAARWALLPWRW